MKKKIRNKLILWLSIACCMVTVSACSCGGEVIDINGLNGYDYNSTPAFGAEPDEDVLIDGKLDEELWENLDYMSFSDPLYPVKVHVATHFSQKGLYIGAYSEDSKVYWNGRNYFNYNTSFHFRIASQEQTSYTNAVKSFAIDANNVGPCSLRVNAESAVLGEPVNSGGSDGLSMEAFLLWEDLGFTLQTELDEQGNEVKILPEKIQLCPMYRHVLSESGTSSRGYNVLQSFNYDREKLSNYAEFGENGYLAVDLVDAMVGDSVDGMVKSAGWDISKENEGIVSTTKGDYQGIFFKVDWADSFVISTKIRYKKGLSTISSAKAGLFAYKDSVNYRAIAIDFGGTNLNNNKPINNALSAGTHYPNNSYVNTNLNPDPTQIQYDKTDDVELTVIKDGVKFYYIVNGRFVWTEQQDYMLGAAATGLYSANGEIEFYDYSFQSFDGNKAGLENEIGKYCYTITVPSVYEYQGGTITADKTALSNSETDAKVNISVTINSGYKLVDVYNNGESILDIAVMTGNGFVLENIDENVNITAEFSRLTASRAVTLKGVLYAENGENTVAYGQMEFVAKDENNQVVPLSCVKTMATAHGQFNVVLQKGYKYEVTCVGEGYRRGVSLTDILESDVSDYKIYLKHNVVGGSVNESFDLGGNYNPNQFTVRASTKTDLWDLSNEENNEAYFETTNWSTGNVYFTNQAGYDFVAEVTITNVTNTNMGTYEKYPNAGFTVTNGASSMSFRLYDKGLVIYPVGITNWADRISVSNLTSKPTVGTIGAETKFKLIRVDSVYHIFINDNLVYKYTDGDITINAKTTNSAGAIVYEDLPSPVAVGFCSGSTYAMKLKFSDYSIAFDDEAMEEIHKTIYSKVEVVGQEDAIEFIEGVNEDGYVELGENFTVKAKGLEQNSVCVLKVYGSDAASYTRYLLTPEAPILTIKATKDMITYFEIEKVTQTGTVTGTISTVDGASVTNATALFLWDNEKGAFELPLNNGAFSVNLPYGDYILKGVLEGYYSKKYAFSVNSSSINLPNYCLDHQYFTARNNDNGADYTEYFERKDDGTIFATDTTKIENTLIRVSKSFDGSGDYEAHVRFIYKGGSTNPTFRLLLTNGKNQIQIYLDKTLYGIWLYDPSSMNSNQYNTSHGFGEAYSAGVSNATESNPFIFDLKVEKVGDTLTVYHTIGTEDGAYTKLLERSATSSSTGWDAYFYKFLTAETMYLEFMVREVDGTPKVEYSDYYVTTSKKDE